jgi:hypothetical protein
MAFMMSQRCLLFEIWRESPFNGRLDLNALPRGSSFGGRIYLAGKSTTHGSRETKRHRFHLPLTDIQAIKRLSVLCILLCVHLSYSFLH